MKILIVDDEKETCSLITEFFSAMGYAVESAHDGIEALKTYETFQPDFILLDIRMPKMDGLEFLDNVNQHPNGRACRILVTTGAQDNELAKKCHEKGAHGFFSKPIQLDEILSQIEKLS